MKQIPLINGSPVTHEQIELRTSCFVCWDCGRQFLTDLQKERTIIVTAHESNCGLCQKYKSVIHIRNWNYLKLPND